MMRYCPRVIIVMLFVVQAAATANIQDSQQEIPRQKEEMSVSQNGLSENTASDLENSRFVKIELLHPHFPRGFQTNLLTSAWFLTAGIPIGQSTILISELPLAHAASGIDFVRHDSETMIGNPYVGFELYGDNSPILWEFGIRIPIFSGDKIRARRIGMFADFDRREAFLSDFFSLTGKINYINKNDSNVLFRLWSGPTVFFNDFSINAFLDYGARIGYAGSKFSLLVNLTGRLLVTIGDPVDPNVTQIGVESTYLIGKVRPGVVFRVPLDNDLPVDYILGITTEIRFE